MLFYYILFYWVVVQILTPIGSPPLYDILQKENDTVYEKGMVYNLNIKII